MVDITLSALFSLIVWSPTIIGVGLIISMER